MKYTLGTPQAPKKKLLDDPVPTDDYVIMNIHAMAWIINHPPLHDEFKAYKALQQALPNFLPLRFMQDKGFRWTGIKWVLKDASS